MISDKFDLAFKGSRKYIHGTDILTQALDCVDKNFQGNLTNISFSIQRMTSNNLKMQFEPLDKCLDLQADDVAIIRLSADGCSIQARIKQDVGEPDLRLPYIESKVTDFCQVDRGSRNIRLLHDDSGYDKIEVLIAMNKALHLAVLDKPIDTDWVFCRWDSPTWPLPETLSGVIVSLKQTLGTRLTCADVELDGRKLGQIYFSAKSSA